MLAGPRTQRLLLALGGVAVACSGRGGPGRPSAAPGDAGPGPAACRPDGEGRIPPPPPGPADEARCARDTECALTTLLDRSCCSDGCSLGRPLTRRALDRLTAQRQRCCQGVDLAARCPVWGCQPFAETARPRCDQGACVALLEPVCQRTPGDARIPRLEPALSAERGCQRDEDCVATTERSGSCCGDPCAEQAVNRVFLQRLEAYRRDCCQPADFECDAVRCQRARITPRCRDGACTGEPSPG
jgi:hypothetical protein